MERKVFDDLQTIIVNLSKIKKMTAKAQAEILKPYGISSGHAAYVMALYGGGMTMKELSEMLCVGPANTTRVISTLMKKGYVASDCPKKGGRKFNVFLTETGRLLAEKIREQLTDDSALLHMLTPEEKNLFFTLLEKIAEGYDRHGI